ncbi:IS1595 family transposase [Halodesulfovibrio aestuarii]|uniref:IS1595 family transposase n=1 Tax=Halodesulfovibrio aestuarii TaxID=126333 RepID=A0ABV4JVQ5_9BACT
MPSTHKHHFLLAAEARTISLPMIQKWSDDEVRSFFEMMRWADTLGTPYCPHCSSNELYTIRTRNQWRCKKCNKTFSVTSGTWLHSTKLPLRTILMAIVISANAVKGIAALQLSRDLGVQYKTAYILNQKIRDSIYKNLNPISLKGEVEIDGMRIKPSKSVLFNKKANRRKKNEVTVLTLKQREGHNLAERFITRVVPSENKDDIRNFVEENVAKDTTIFSDCGAGYTTLHASYDLRTVNHSKEFSGPNGENINGIESNFSRYRRFLTGQIHHQHDKYLHLYAQEIAFREENRRRSNGDLVEMLLIHLLSLAEDPEFRGYWGARRRVTTARFSDSFSSAA